MATTKIGLAANTQDPLGTLQLQFYTTNAKVVSSVTSIGALMQSVNVDIPAQITAMQATLAAQTALLTTVQTYMTNNGLDVTKPLTQAQIDAMTTAGLITSAV